MNQDTKITSVTLAGGIGPNDVICGRGGLANTHEGNLKYRQLIEKNIELYAASPKMQKLLLAKSIVEAIRNQEPAGRFLQRDKNSSMWTDIGEQKAVRKTSQTFRDCSTSEARRRNRDNDTDTATFVVETNPLYSPVSPRKRHRFDTSEPVNERTSTKKMRDCQQVNTDLDISDLDDLLENSGSSKESLDDDFGQWLKKESFSFDDICDDITGEDSSCNSRENRESRAPVVSDDEQSSDEEDCFQDIHDLSCSSSIGGIGDDDLVLHGMAHEADTSISFSMSEFLF